MNDLRLVKVTAASLSLALLCGCATGHKTRLSRQTGESMMFIGETPAALAYLPARSQPLRVRSDYQPGPATTNYIEGTDFIVDYAGGTIRRTANSRLPDFRTNMLFGQEEFDHSKFPGYGNNGFFAFVDYDYSPSTPWPVQSSQVKFLKAAQAKLARGDSLKIVAFGDSITDGGEATQPGLIFWQRWADDLQRKYPRARITAVNGSTGGGDTILAMQRLQTKVLDARPDLVLIGYGMNDHNKGRTTIPLFEKNLKEIIARIRRESSAEVILFSAFPPNPRWKHGSHHMQDYAAATERVARETECAFADVFNNWQAMTARKKPEDLLANNINHPNDFGHWIYYRVFGELGL